MYLCLVNIPWHFLYHVCIVYVDNWKFITPLAPFLVLYIFPCFTLLGEQNLIVHNNEARKIWCLVYVKKHEFLYSKFFSDFKILEEIMSTWTNAWPCMYLMWALVDISLTIYVCLSIHVVCEWPLTLSRKDLSFWPEKFSPSVLQQVSAL